MPHTIAPAPANATQSFPAHSEEALAWTASLLEACTPGELDLAAAAHPLWARGAAYLKAHPHAPVQAADLTALAAPWLT